DELGVADELAERLLAEGIRPMILRPGANDSFDDLVHYVPLDRRTLIVFAAGLSWTPSAPWNGLAASAVPLLLSLAQTLHKREAVPRLCVVTNAAGGVDDDAHLDLG